MPAIFSTNAIIMGPAKMMDHASVILDSSATTVQVNLQRPFMMVFTVVFFVRFSDFASQNFEKCFKKYIIHFANTFHYTQLLG
jgi:hypothetical protein